MPNLICSFFLDHSKCCLVCDFCARVAAGQRVRPPRVWACLRRSARLLVRSCVCSCDRPFPLPSVCIPSVRTSAHLAPRMPLRATAQSNFGQSILHPEMIINDFPLLPIPEIHWEYQNSPLRGHSPKVAFPNFVLSMFHSTNSWNCLLFSKLTT